MASLFNFPFRWGVKMLPVNPWLIDQQIHWSGITTIISDEPIVKDLLGKFRFIDQVTVIGNARVNELAMNQNYFVYRFMNPIAEYLESKPKLFNSTDETSWRMMIDRWWASDSEIQTTWIQSEEKLNQWNEDKSGELNVKFINSEKIELNSSSNTNRWILLKETYFPNWKAFENGIEIPVYRASPHLMAVFAKGKIEFRFLRSNLEWISIFITLLAAMMLIGIFLMQVKRKWMK